MDLVDGGDAPVVVSTVHRAKGLEFDNVVLLRTPEDSMEQQEEDLHRRARALYVALSRAREIITVVEPLRAGGLRPDGYGAQKRWIQGGARWQTTGFEVQLRDVERGSPFGADPEEAVKVQDLLRTSLQGIGLRIYGRLDHTCDPASPRYDLSVDGHEVAATSADFGAVLSARLTRAWRDHPGPPVALRDLHTDGVETAAGPPQVGERLGVGRWGLWLALRVGGLARLDHARAEER